MALGALSIPVTHPAPAEVAAWLAAVSLAGLGRPAGAHPDWEREAGGAARSWLRLVDEGRHSASWAAASGLLKGEIGPGGWSSALRSVRAPLGRCLGRTLRSTAVVLGPPGDLRGPYAVLRFETAFEGREPVTETVTPVLGPDGRWRVGAYFLR
jgi:hypothetical protein